MKNNIDGFAAVQRAQQLKQAEAANNKELLLERTIDKLTGWLLIIGFVLLIPTLFTSFILVLISFAVYYGRNKIYVKNVKNGDKFWLTKEDWKKYKKHTDNNKKQIVSLSNIEKDK